MYKLVYMSAVNVIGFMSGLGRKRFEIDLHDFYDKEVILCVGGNATGKSTFLSLVHPVPYPTNGKRKFIIKGKEGLLVRIYEALDGTTITTKCVYKPKRDEGHTVSCYFELKKPDEEEGIELNPNGNVTSYEELLYQYFGINKDFITYATFNNEVASIVQMTDTERKNSISTLVPNTKRFEVGYNIVNEKYKNLRNLIRNLSQQILALRDEDSMKRDLHRISDDLKRYTQDREDRIKELGEMEGRLKELTGGVSLADISAEYDAMVTNELSYGVETDKQFRAIHKLYKALGIVPNSPDSIQFKGIESVRQKVQKFQERTITAQQKIENLRARRNDLRNQSGIAFKEKAEIETSLYSIQTESIDELNRSLDECNAMLDELEYSKHIEKYEGMSYDEVIGLSRAVSTISSMVQALYDTYGQLVSDYFDQKDIVGSGIAKRHEMDTLTVSLQTMSAKRDMQYQKLLENQQYAQLTKVLERRPPSCTIDTCPFISEALKYQDIASSIEEMKREFENSQIQIQQASDRLNALSRSMAIHNDAQTVIRYITDNIGMIAKYYKIKSIDKVLHAIAHGTWDDLLNISHLKDLAAILSEKDLYLELTMQRIPAIQHSIELAKAYGTNRTMLQTQLSRVDDRIADLNKTITDLDSEIELTTAKMSDYQTKWSLWDSLDAAIGAYQEAADLQLHAHEIASKKEKEIEVIRELNSNCKKQDAAIQELDRLILDRNPEREKLKLDLDALRRLNIEKLEIERNFTVIDVVRAVMSPGKGIRKVLINMYMYEIYLTANQLLLHTFDGKLYLKEFVITDKEFSIPYVYNGTESPDISYASSAQQATIATAISLAILSKLIDKYGVYTPDELDAPMSPSRKAEFINVLIRQMHYIGITQAIMITQNPKQYEPYNVGFICFPGAELDGQSLDVIEIQ